MTRGMKILKLNSKLEILAAPAPWVVQKISEPPSFFNSFAPLKKGSLDCIKYIYRYCLQWFIL